MSLFKRTSLIAVALVAALGASGCSDDDNPVAPAASPARVMAVHASPDAPAVDLLVDNAIAGTARVPEQHGVPERRRGIAEHQSERDRDRDHGHRRERLGDQRYELHGLRRRFGGGHFGRRPIRRPRDAGSRQGPRPVRPPLAERARG